MWIGIDPGQSGGIAFLDADHKLYVWSMPETERDIYDIFEELQPFAECAIIEAVHSMPGQGVSSVFKFGQGYGFLRGMLIAHKIPFLGVTPQKWQKTLGISSPKGSTKTEHKNILKGFAQQIFPSVKLTLSTADAALIAEFCWRTHGQITS